MEDLRLNLAESPPKSCFRALAHRGIDSDPYPIGLPLNSAGHDTLDPALLDRELRGHQLPGPSLSNIARDQSVFLVFLRQGG